MSKYAKISPDILEALSQAVAQIKYGQIQITVHDSKIVQIDKTEKIRFDANAERRPAA